MGEIGIKKIHVRFALILVVLVVAAGLIGAVSFAAPIEPHGAISVAFDDGMQSQYDYAFPLMAARGIVGTFYVITDAIRDFSNSSVFMSIAELQTLQDYGCEIASHSKTHPAFTGISDSQIHYQCYYSKQFLQSYGLTVNNFAYPYGSRNNHTDSIVADYYRSARSGYVGPYIMQFPVSQFLLPGFPGETGDSTALSKLESMVDQVYSTNGWAIIFFHNIIPDANNTLYTISSQDFESFLDYLLLKGVATITVNQGLARAATYSVTIKAACLTQPAWTSVPITMDGLATGYSTSYTFTVSGTHTFTVPATDAHGHPFLTWDTGSTSRTITVSGAGTHVACYQGEASIDVWTNKASYSVGETMKVYLQSYNPHATFNVRLIMKIGLPGGGTLGVADTVIPLVAGDSGALLAIQGPVQSGSPSGVYKWIVELRNPYFPTVLIDSDEYYFRVT